MAELISALIGSTLAGLAVDFLKAVVKKTAKALKDLFSEDELKSVLSRSYLEFKEDYIKEGGTKDEEILIETFKEFFMDDRTIMEFQRVFDARSETVDFNLLEEIFAAICTKKRIEIATFNFFQAMGYVVKEIERLAQKEEKLQETFQTAHLVKIKKYLQKRGTEENFTFARFKYLYQLMLHNNRLQFTGIPHPQEKKDIELPSVFVMQRVRESVPEQDYRRFMQERMHEEGVPGEDLHEIELRRMMPVKAEEKQEPVKFDKVFEESTNPRFVVLGKPGSGKSTLLKFLMLEAAQMHLDYHRESHELWFPILVEIRKFENALSKTNQPDYNILDYLYDSMSRNYSLRLPGGFFEKYLDSGRALLLFDGLDEVAAEARRAEVRQMINTFTTGYHMGNRVIVTSRIAGYSRAQFSTTDYRHFELEDFNDEEIDTFIHRWYRSRMTNEVEADSKADDLKKALEGKPRIKELAKNPLLLTIIGIIHRYEAQLPEDRLILYDKATEALLYTWDNVKEIIDEKFKPEYKRQFLEKVAFHLQSIEKGDEAGTVIERNEVYKILFPDFRQIFCCDNREAKSLVDEFLAKIRSRAGLLVELGPDQYGFVHKTFQEYFAAKWIANEAIINFDLEKMIDYVDKFVDNAFWHETLLLTLCALPGKQAQKVLEHILKRDPKGIESYFYHNHYFVMKFIAEQGRQINRDFVKEQVDDFFHFSWNDNKNRSYGSNYTWNRFQNGVSNVSDSVTMDIFSNKLLSIAEDDKQDGYIRRGCAIVVGNSRVKEKAVKILLHLADDEKQYDDLRCSCIYAVGNLGVKDKTVLERLLHLAEDDKQRGDFRRYCVYAVGNLGVKDKIVLKSLLRLAEDGKQSSYLRRSCASTVGNLGMKDKTVLERLLLLAEDEKQSGSLRSSCASAVGNLGMKGKAVEILLHLAEDKKQDGYLRLSCSSAVGNLGMKEETVLERLLLLAEDDKQSGSIRRSCAEAVGNLGMKDKAAEILLALAEDKKQRGDLRRECVSAVGSLGVKDKTAVKRLLLLAEDEKQDRDLRLSCSSAVGKLGAKDKTVVERLLHLAEDSRQECYLRLSCVSAVGNLGVKDKAVEILLVLAEDDSQHGDFRRYCAFALGNIGVKDKAMEILLALAEDEKQSGYLRRDCAAAIGNIGVKDKTVVERLLHLAEDEKQSGSLRHSCADAAGKLGVKDKAVDILIDLYLAQTNKYETLARYIYNSLWDLTDV